MKQDNTPEIFVTSFLIADNDIVRGHETAKDLGRVNGFDFIHGDAERDMTKHGGYDIPCFFNHCPTETGIYPVTILYKDRDGAGTYYLWHDGFRMRGLIVDNSDTPSVTYAKEVFEKKQNWL